VIEMPEEEARAALKEYRQAVRAREKERYAEARRDYEAIDRAVMRGYKEIAKGHSLLRLSETIAAGGVEERTWQGEYWRDGSYYRATLQGTFPRLAICRADARQVLCAGVSSDGSVIYHANESWSSRRADRVRLDAIFPEPEARNTRIHRAIVPTIPPPFRPQYKLSGYHILWEAEWDLSAPADPALLKHLGGDLYAVLAVWDLTELEQAVLAGLRS
jgi:hypothetical protein